MSENTISDSDKRDGGPMRYLRHQRSRNRFQDEEPKTNSQKPLSDGKNVNFLVLIYNSFNVHMYKFLYNILIKYCMNIL